MNDENLDRIRDLVLELDQESRLAADVIHDICNLVDETNVKMAFEAIPDNKKRLFVKIAKSCSSDSKWIYLGNPSQEAEGTGCPFSDRTRNALSRWYSAYSTDRGQ